MPGLSGLSNHSCERQRRPFGCAVAAELGLCFFAIMGSCAGLWPDIHLCRKGAPDHAASASAAPQVSPELKLGREIASLKTPASWLATVSGCGMFAPEIFGLSSSALWGLAQSLVTPTLGFLFLYL